MSSIYIYIYIHTYIYIYIHIYIYIYVYIYIYITRTYTDLLFAVLCSAKSLRLQLGGGFDNVFGCGKVSQSIACGFRVCGFAVAGQAEGAACHGECFGEAVDRQCTLPHILKGSNCSKSHTLGILRSMQLSLYILLFSTGSIPSDYMILLWINPPSPLSCHVMPSEQQRMRALCRHNLKSRLARGRRHFFLSIGSIVVSFWGYLAGSYKYTWCNQERNYNGDHRYLLKVRTNPLVDFI